MKNTALENEKKILLKSQQNFESNKNVIGSHPEEFPGMNLKGSVIPAKAKLGPIKEEGDNLDDNLLEELGNNYIEDNDEENEINLIKKEKEKKVKQSRLKFSTNIFDFTDKNDENYVNDLKNEINGLYKLRDSLNDKLIQKEQQINEIDNELKKAKLENDELKKIINKKDDEINQLKNVWDESS